MHLYPWYGSKMNRTNKKNMPRTVKKWIETTATGLAAPDSSHYQVAAEADEGAHHRQGGAVQQHALSHQGPTGVGVPQTVTNGSDAQGSEATQPPSPPPPTTVLA